MNSSFENHTRKIMQLSNQEAQRLNSEMIGTGHILLALIRVCNVLENCGLIKFDCELESVRHEVRQLIIPADHSVVGKVPLNSDAQRAVDYAATLSNDGSVSPIHLLIGILQDDDAVAARVLSRSGMSPDEVLREAHAAIAT